METQPESPEAGEGVANVTEIETAEDLPSDFFDEFSKDEFIEGLSIIDSWDDSGLKSKQLQTKSHENGDEDKISSRRLNEKRRISQSSGSSRLDEFIKPGSRRDPNKTNEAIKKDKEEKVKEFLAKTLQSSDELRPPGTELDGYFEENKEIKKDTTPIKDTPAGLRKRSRSRERRPRELAAKSSHRSRDSPVTSSYRHSRRSPQQLSPLRRRKSPKALREKLKRYSPAHRSPRRVSPRRSSPRRSSPRRSSPRRSSPRRSSPRRNLRLSPRRSPRRVQRSPYRVRRSCSRSPYKRSYESHRSRSPINHTDRFLYPLDSNLPQRFALNPLSGGPYHMPPGSYPGSVPNDYPCRPGYSFAPAYAGGYNSSNLYDYGDQAITPSSIALPQTRNPIPAPNTSSNPIPLMVPAPNILSSAPVPQLPPVSHQDDLKTSYDALAKLVAEGKISEADYLKLAPNKGPSSSLDNSHRGKVLARCNQALNSLGKLHLPNHLLMNNNMMDVHADTKYLAPKFCSPLKRQAPVEFLFTKADVDATAQQNKNMVDSIIASLPELEKLITRPKKKTQKNMKDAAVQTYKPYCDVCDIRENTQFNDVSTSIDPDNFCSTVHTQVVEQDLINSKSVFNPSGSVGDTATMSIAHLTPAQLVSQLAARAKTLKQPDHSNQMQRAPSNSYDYNYDDRSGEQYQNYNNYRY